MSSDATDLKAMAKAGIITRREMKQIEMGKLVLDGGTLYKVYIGQRGRAVRKLAPIQVKEGYPE